MRYWLLVNARWNWISCFHLGASDVLSFWMSGKELVCSSFGTACCKLPYLHISRFYWKRMRYGFLLFYVLQSVMYALPTWCRGRIPSSLLPCLGPYHLVSAAKFPLHYYFVIAHCKCPLPIGRRYFALLNQKHKDIRIP